jgi:hypothetical protein
LLRCHSILAVRNEGNGGAAPIAPGWQDAVPHRRRVSMKAAEAAAGCTKRPGSARALRETFD